MKSEREWAEHMPSEGENPERAMKQSSRDGVEEKVRSPEGKDAARAAPAKADPHAAEKNREFVEHDAMRYNDAEERSARGK